MTRTITTRAELYALPVGSVVMEGDHIFRRFPDGWYVARGTSWAKRDVPLPATVLDDLSARASSPSVVPEAAVEAFKAAWHKADDEGREGERVRDGLTAAFPLLTAAPSATREEVAEALESEFGCFLARDPNWHDIFWGGAADSLLARFTITRKEGR